jgi:cation/acetate symporter
MPNISDKKELLAARVAIAFAVVVSGIAGFNPPDYVAAIVAFAFGLAASSFFPAIILGIFDKRMNVHGAVTGMIVGLLFTASYIIYFKFGGGTPDQYWFKISPEGIGTIGMLINLLISVVVSRMTPPPPESVQEMVESIRIPRGTGKANAH